MTLPTNARNNYRPDIDGLRGFAVLAVILFHINPQWLPGGFVGVDIFFVISGYLITSIVSKELCENRFTFRRFYERRIRRILPALWVLLVVCVPVSWRLMLPQDAEPMGKSALWATLAMANLYFWREVSTDYFAPQSTQFPFLHLWSLGVEEQFYVLWPLVMVIVWNIARRNSTVIACAIAFAFVMASTLLGESLLADQESRFAYYMLPSRAGELALGAALSLTNLTFREKSNASLIAMIAAVVGWALLIYSIVELNEHYPFPGWRALLPTFGSAALILSGQLVPTSICMIPLRWGVIIWLGRCSYSAYLWHWPLLAWYRYLWGEPDITMGLTLLSLILIIARISQFLVEDPARQSRMTFKRTLILFCIAPALLISTFALLAARGERWGLQLYTKSDRDQWTNLETYTRPAHHEEWVCQQNFLDPASLTDPKCEFGTGKGPARILLLGDSHAAEFSPLLRVAAEEQHLRIRSVALGSCAPLSGSLYGVVDDSRLEACEKGIPQILELAKNYPYIIIGAAWSGYANRTPDVWLRLESELLTLTAQGHKIWLLPKVPEFLNYDAACPAKQVRVGSWLQCPKKLVPREDLEDTNMHLAAIAERISGVQFLPIHKLLCSGEFCKVADSAGQYLYADPSHLSVHGSRLLATELIWANQMPNISKVFSLKN